MKILPLTRGYETKVDDDIAQRLDLLRIHLHVKTNTSGATAAGLCYRGKNVLLHRWIMHAQPDQCCDHINGDPLDNQRSNLRFATHRQNMHNRKINGGECPNMTGYAGVHRTKIGRFVANYTENDSSLYIGTFRTAVQAAVARDYHVKKARGEFARLNFPDGIIPDGLFIQLLNPLCEFNLWRTT